MLEEKPDVEQKSAEEGKRSNSLKDSEKPAEHIPQNDTDYNVTFVMECASPHGIEILCNSLMADIRRFSCCPTTSRFGLSHPSAQFRVRLRFN